jgi:hypothetical protein
MGKTADLNPDKVIFEEYPRRVNNKEKQASVGNWGHPRPFLKRKTKIKPYPAAPKHRSKKKRPRKSSFISFHVCPFCHAELPPKPGLTISFLPRNRVDECPECKARMVPECPACKRDTWYDPEKEEYKHQWFGCGFSGKKIPAKKK